MTSYPELEVRYTDRTSDSGWTEKQAVESALEEHPLTVLMYCLHALRVNVRDVFPPTTLATVVDVKEITKKVGGAAREMGGDTISGGGVENKVGGVGGEEEEEEEEEEDEDEDNAITIEQISDWLQV